MIYLAILRRAAPFLILAALVGLAIWKYGRDVDLAYTRGKLEVQAKWEASDKLAREVGAAQTRMLARNAILATEKSNEKLSTLDRLVARNRADLAQRDSSLAGLRDELAKRAATPPSGDTSPAACGRHERLRRTCESLLSEGADLAREADRLAGEGEEVSRRGQLTLESLQDWARVVQTYEP